MLPYRFDRLLSHLQRRRLACRLAVAAIVFAGTAAAGDDADADPPRSEPRSHIQSAGEMAAARGAADAPASTKVASPFGLVVDRVPDLLREHLALSRGVGLVVDEVVAGSSAATAGFKPHDVLVAIDEQSLIVPEQFNVLLAGEGPAAPKSCTLIRNGQRQTIALAPAAPATSTSTATTTAAAASTDAPPSVKPKRSLTPPASALAMLPKEKKPPAAATEQQAREFTGVVRRKGDSCFVLADRDYAIEILREDETLLTVRNARGRPIFRDVIETPEQRSLIPVAVRDRVEQLERQFGQPMQATARPRPVAEIGRLDIEPVQIK